jgi:hypothetical protein
MLALELAYFRGHPWITSYADVTGGIICVLCERSLIVVVRASLALYTLEGDRSHASPEKINVVCSSPYRAIYAVLLGQHRAQTLGQGLLAARDDQTVTDWYNCVSWDGGYSWSCEYLYTTYSGSPTIEGPGEVDAPSNCSDAAYEGTCRDAYLGSASSGGIPVPTQTGVSDVPGYCLVNGLCSPSLDSLKPSDVCPALGSLCEDNGEEPPDPWVQVFAGHYSGFDGCRDGILTFSLHGNWQGEPANYNVGATRKYYFGAQGGFQEVAAYAVIIDVLSGSGNRRYEGLILVDCTDGTFIGGARPRNR